MSGDPTYLKLLDEMREMHIAKSAGYGKDIDPWANFRLAVGFGVSPFIGCLVRMGDKFTRVQNLSTDPSRDKVGEGIQDTLMDLASYALIAICLWREAKNAEQPVRL